MRTNRDLYKAIEGLILQKQDQAIPTLEVYLSNLLRRAHQFAQAPALSLEQLFHLLRDSFEDSRNVPEPATVEDAVAAFAEWHTLITAQIQDLRAMTANGQLQDPQRYFGISAPSGRYWYNFDPCTYLECGAAGAFGGWEEGDETGRFYVSGPVASFDDDGNLISVDPRELDRPPVEMPQITWAMFSDFAECGQLYE